MNSQTAVALFNEQKIRRAWHNEQWWFSIADVVHALTSSPDSGAYWRKLKQRLKAEGSEVVTNCHALKLLAPDGKHRKTDCANTQSLLRIIQSIPSPKAEPFKAWLAQVGFERIQEIENPGEIKEKSFQDVIRLAYTRGILKNSWDMWWEYRDNRNATSHGYDEKRAIEIISRIPTFYHEVAFLLDELRSRNEA